MPLWCAMEVVNTPHRRVLLAVSPRMFSDALERLLCASSGMEVTVGRPGEGARSPDERFDAAIVTSPELVHAATFVIELSETDGRRAVVHTEGEDVVIDLRDVAGVIALLDEVMG